MQETYRLESMEVMSKTGTKPHARLSLSVNDNLLTTESTGSGPVDAAFKAIEKVANSGADLKLYSVNAITSGTDSQGEVTVRLERSGRIINGNGADTDIVVASIKAYLNALNILMSGTQRINPQEGENI